VGLPAKGELARNHLQKGKYREKKTEGKGEERKGGIPFELTADPFIFRITGEGTHVKEQTSTEGGRCKGGAKMNQFGGKNSTAGTGNSGEGHAEIESPCKRTTKKGVVSREIGSQRRKL